MRHASREHGVAVLGGGPAGLTAGLVLAQRGVAGRVFEADKQVGGIAKTVERGGFRLDLGAFGCVPCSSGSSTRRPRPARRPPSSTSSIDGRG